jgi:hypothetical protein
VTGWRVYLRPSEATLGHLSHSELHSDEPGQSEIAQFEIMLMKKFHIRLRSRENKIE